MVAEVVPAFDYASLAPDVRTTVETATRRLHDLERRTAESIIDMGKELSAVKAAMPYGQFGAWLDAEFGWSRFTAYRMMQVAEHFGDKSSTVQHLGAKVLYALAAPSTPEDIRTEFTGLAAIGQRVTHKDVREAIDERRQPTRAESIPVDKWDDDGPVSEVPYEVVDLDSGELFGPGVVSRTVAYQPTAEREQFPRPSPIMEPTYDTPERNANQVAVHLTMRHGKDQARRIAFAILDQTGGRG